MDIFLRPLKHGFLLSYTEGFWEGKEIHPTLFRYFILLFSY